jgi:hypothetical protein
VSDEFQSTVQRYDDGAGPYAAPQAPTSFQAPAQLPHSGLGIASFVIGILAGIAMLAIFIYAGYAESTTPGGLSEDSTAAVVIGLLVIGCGGLLLVGALLGIAALFISGHRKLFAIIGTVFNLVPIAMAIFLIVLGLSMTP